MKVKHSVLSIAILLLTACSQSDTRVNETDDETKKSIASSIETASEIHHSKGLILGNSIAQGSGASDFKNTWSHLLGEKLHKFNDSVSVSQWRPDNFGVGGATTATPVMYLSYGIENNVTVVDSKFDEYDYLVALTMRNDVSVYNVDEFKTMLRTMFNMIEGRGLTTYYVIDPPKIDMDTGELIDSYDNWTVYYYAALQLCREFNVTVVDVWDYHRRMMDDGMDLTSFSKDGVHPNDAGHEIIANLMFEKLTTQDLNNIAIGNMSLDTGDNLQSLSVYKTDGDSTIENVDGKLSSSTTSRKFYTGVSDISVIKMSKNESVTFSVPMDVKGVLVNMLLGTHYQSQPFDVKFNNEYVATGVNAYNSQYLREFTHYIEIPRGEVSPGALEIIPSGDNSLLGVAFLTVEES